MEEFYPGKRRVFSYRKRERERESGRIDYFSRGSKPEKSFQLFYSEAGRGKLLLGGGRGRGFQYRLRQGLIAILAPFEKLRVVRVIKIFWNEGLVLKAFDIRVNNLIGVVVVDNQSSASQVILKNAMAF